MSGASEILPMGITADHEAELVAADPAQLAAIEPLPMVAVLPKPEPELQTPASPWEWPVRVLFGVLLAVLAITALSFGGFYFAGFVGLIAVTAGREWHRLVAGPSFGVETVLTGAIVLAALAVFALWPRDSGLWSLAILAAGAGLSAGVAHLRGTSELWNGIAPLYLGVPALSMVALDHYQPHGGWIVFEVFLITWAADSGALIFGKLIGGPKLAKKISPNKTWAGFIGGTLLPALIASAIVAVLGGDAEGAAIFGVVLALAGHAGDLFESWVKRSKGIKNSGGLIPGHGGMLDRIDSALFVATTAAIAIFVLGIDPLFGAFG